MENGNIREREELHKAIWSIANDLRGSVDGWDFKQYHQYHGKEEQQLTVNVGLKEIN